MSTDRTQIINLVRSHIAAANKMNTPAIRRVTTLSISLINASGLRAETRPRSRHVRTLVPVALPSSDQVELTCAGDCGGAAGDVELSIHAGDVGLRRIAGDE